MEDADQLLDDLKHADPEVRRAAIHALGKHTADARVIPALVAMLRDPETLVRRRISAWLMGRAGNDPRLVAPLIRVMQDETVSLGARDFAAMLLGKLGDPAAVPPLCAMLRDRSVMPIWPRVTHSLMRLADPRSVEALAQALKSDNPHVYKTAEIALERIGTPEALAALRSAPPR
jgi:HEAT repeat protein